MEIPNRRKTHSTLGSLGNLDNLDFLGNLDNLTNNPSSTRRNTAKSKKLSSNRRKTSKKANNKPSNSSNRSPSNQQLIQNCLIELNQKFKKKKFELVKMPEDNIILTKGEFPLTLLRDASGKEYFIKKSTNLKTFNFGENKKLTPKEGIMNKFLKNLFDGNPCSSNLLIPFYVSENLETIVIEKKDMDLVDYLYMSQEIIDQEGFITILRDLLNAVHCLHIGSPDYIIIHGDIKPENILLEFGERNNIKKAILFDFDGIAVITDSEDSEIPIKELMNQAISIDSKDRNKIYNRLSKVNASTHTTHNFFGKETIPVDHPDIFQDIYSIAMTMLMVFSVILMRIEMEMTNMNSQNGQQQNYTDYPEILDNFGKEFIIAIREDLERPSMDKLEHYVNMYFTILKDYAEDDINFPYKKNFLMWLNEYILEMLYSRNKKKNTSYFIELLDIGIKNNFNFE